MSGGEDSGKLFSKQLGTESNGEISCTVDETNRIRAMLGLRPLDMGKPVEEQQAVDNFRAQKEAEDKARETREIAERLEKAKEKRLLHAKLQGTGLGDAANEDAAEFASAADWVKRSRKQEVLNKEKEQKTARRLQEDEEEALAAAGSSSSSNSSSANYRSSDLQGLSVMHGAEDFATGQDVILTLADSSVLEVDARGRARAIREDDDVLENVNMADADRKLEREKAQKKSKQLYTGLDDAEFEPGAGTRAKPSVLPQYDKERASGPKLVLGHDGRIAAEAGAGAMAVQDQGEDHKPLSLRVDVRESEDYYSKAEYSSFKPKEKDKDKKKKTKKKLRQKEQSDVMDLEGSAQAQATGPGKAAVPGNGGSVGNGAGNGTKGEAEEEDDDAEIALSLARARRLALKRQREESEGSVGSAGTGGTGREALAPPASTDDAGARFSKQRVAEIKSAEAANESKSDTQEWNSVNVDGRKADGTFVFSETTEFSTRLQAQLNETARSRAEAAVKLDERKQQQAEAKRRHLAEEAPAGSGGGGAEGVGAGMDVDVEDGLDDVDDDIEAGPEVAPMGRQSLAASSMAATLALLKDTGELRAGEKLVGRAKDLRQLDPSSRDFDVKLEYRDETGRKLTQKEAFRQLNYQFHGVAPGKKKQEKRLKQLQLEDRSGSSRVVSGEGGTMRSLVRAQEATGSAFITVQVNGCRSLNLCAHVCIR